MEHRSKIATFLLLSIFCYLSSYLQKPNISIDYGVPLSLYPQNESFNNLDSLPLNGKYVNQRIASTLKKTNEPRPMFVISDLFIDKSYKEWDITYSNGLCDEALQNSSYHGVYFQISPTIPISCCINKAKYIPYKLVPLVHRESFFRPFKSYKKTIKTNKVTLLFEERFPENVYSNCSSENYQSLENIIRLNKNNCSKNYQHSFKQPKCILQTTNRIFQTSGTKNMITDQIINIFYTINDTTIHSVKYADFWGDSKLHSISKAKIPNYVYVSCIDPSKLHQVTQHSAISKAKTPNNANTSCIDPPKAISKGKTPNYANASGTDPAKLPQIMQHSAISKAKTQNYEYDLFTYPSKLPQVMQHSAKSPGNRIQLSRLVLAISFALLGAAFSTKAPSFNISPKDINRLKVIYTLNTAGQLALLTVYQCYKRGDTSKNIKDHLIKDFGITEYQFRNKFDNRTMVSAIEDTPPSGEAYDMSTLVKSLRVLSIYYDPRGNERKWRDKKGLEYACQELANIRNEVIHSVVGLDESSMKNKINQIKSSIKEIFVRLEVRFPSEARDISK
ncbi:unnamed protein product, partial [Meganyctiphanes norvegica]